MWTIHNLDAIEIEGGKFYSNSNYTLQMVYLEIYGGMLVLKKNL